MADTTLSFNVLARDNASGTFKKVGQAAEGTSKSFATVSGVAKVAAGAFAAIQVGGLIKDSVNLEAAFSQTMNTIGAVTNTPKAGLQSLSDLAIKLGADTTFSAKEASDAMLELAKSGISTADIKAGALAGTLTLAAAGGTDLATASTIAANAMNMFALKGKDMGSIAAALAGGANASSASVESLGLALSQVGPGARNAGLSLQDTVGTLSAFDAAGIKGADAGTSLKTMLTRLVPSTAAAKTAMHDLGLKFTDAHGTFLPITNVAQQLKDKLGNLSQEQRTTALSTIFGSDATRAATVLMNQGATGLGKFIAATKDQNAAQQVAAARMSGTAGALESFKGSVETAKLQLGLFLAPVIQGGLKILTKVINGIAPAFAKVSPAISGAIAVFSGLGKKIVKAIGPVDLSGISTGIFNDTKAWAGSVIGGLTKGLATGDWSGLGKSLGDGVIRSIQNLGTVSGRILDALGALIDKVDWGKLGSKISGALLGLIHSVDWKKVGGALGDAFITAVQKSASLVVKVGAAFKTLMDQVDWEKVGHDSTDAIGRFISGIDWARVAVILGKSIWNIGNGVDDIVNSITKAVGKTAWGIAWSIANAMTRGENYVNEKAAELGKYLISGLWSGIKGAMSGVGKFIKSAIVDPIVNWAKSLFGVHSPSTIFAGIGRDLIAGLKSGVVAAAKGIGTWIYRTVIAPAVAPFAKAGTWLVQRGRDFISGLFTGLSQRWQTVARWIGGLRASASGWLGTTSMTLYSKGAQLLQGLWSAAQQKWGKIGPWIGGLPRSAAGWLGNVTRTLAQKGRDILQGFWTGLTSKWTEVTKWVGTIATWIRDHKGPISLDSKLLIPAGQAIMGGFLKGLKSGAGKAWSFVSSVGGKTVSALQSVFGGIGSTSLTGRMTAGVEQWRATALRALAITHSPANWIGSLLRRMQQESGGNPGAINLTDINARRGDPSRGLMQTIGSTFLRFARPGVQLSSIYDPLENIIASINYANARYGAAPRGWDRPGGYALGTPWVPNDQLAFLHRGEGVIPADVNAARLRASSGGGGEFLGTVRIELELDGRVIQQKLLKLKKNNRGELGLA